MTQLANRKRELFARYLADGLTQAEAYTGAGYTASSSNASNLARTPELEARVAELKKEEEEKRMEFRIKLANAGIDPNSEQGTQQEIAWTVDRVRNLLANNALLAQTCGDFKGARESIELIGKSMQMFEKDGNKDNGKLPGPQVSLTLINEAAGGDQGGSGQRIVEGRNSLAPRLPDTAAD